jgi:P-type E1-E2 ATPase
LLTIQISGGEKLELAHLVLDLNGTLSDHGVLIDGVPERLSRLARDLEIHLATADTLGTAQRLGTELALSVATISSGSDKADLVASLGASRTVAIGNGQNDAEMLTLAALGIAVMAGEGAAVTALLAANVVCRSILDALDLLIDNRLLNATLRP